MEVTSLSRKVPTEKEIETQERRLSEMRAARAEAKQLLINALRSEEIVNAIDPNEALSLMKLLQSRIRGEHKKVRGSPVPPELRANLEAALKQGGYTLAQLERMFGLSVSYISRIKRELGLTNVHNAYSNQQIQPMVG